MKTEKQQWICLYHKADMDGISSGAIVHKYVNTLKNIEIDEDIRIHYISIANDTYIIVSNGIDSNLQVNACLSRMCKFSFMNQNTN